MASTSTRSASASPPHSRARAAHFNPLGKKHGLESPEGPHGGDLPDVEADASGRMEYVAVTDRMTLASGPTSIFDADGSAIVIHEQPDDQRTDPSGNSGERLLCGQLVVGPTSSFSRAPSGGHPGGRAPARGPRARRPWYLVARGTPARPDVKAGGA